MSEQEKEAAKQEALRKIGDDGRRIQAFLDDPIIKDFLERQHRAALNGMIHCELSDDDTRRGHAAMLQAVSRLMNYAENAAHLGKRAEKKYAESVSQTQEA